ncbi:putative membrane protein YphA (DoxX/SURF4 family) [Streptosporangium album]|uniref:Putative membrane protein YphA (DoxX/SURF4 family) n=1 Tax=Streptosporangium album TaxID=47479 RepID=A0A7W7WCK4_9ACTN|nr:MauE/DoxX family redox-associated membrane protein [Streptosporangium album]MBB4941354.1 putative membrane protein YphA (DoxX/SURF4 family) [Streptosporangium album]
MGLADLVGMGCGLLAALFVASGIPKIKRPFELAITLVRFGVASRVRPALGRLLGAVEVAVGLAVALSPALLPASAAALLLLVAFTAVIVRSLAVGQNVECACFGTGERTSWVTVVRNLVLIGVALSVAVAPAVPTMDQRISGLLIGTVVTCGYLLISTLAVVKPFSIQLDGQGR